jgi:hypothetical protein
VRSEAFRFSSFGILFIHILEGNRGRKIGHLHLLLLLLLLPENELIYLLHKFVEYTNPVIP